MINKTVAKYVLSVEEMLVASGLTRVSPSLREKLDQVKTPVLHP